MRREAAWKLGERGVRGEQQVIPILLDLLADAGSYVDEAASDALQRIGEPAVAPVLALFQDRSREPHARGWAARILGSMHVTAAVEPMVEALLDPTEDSGVRQMVAFYLGRLGDRRALEPLIDVMVAPNEELRVRINATHAVGELGDRRAFEPLVAALEDPTIAHIAGNALEEMRDERVIELILPDLAASEERRRLVAPIIGKAGPAAIPLLLTALRSDDWRVRAGAAKALSFSEDERAVPDLIELLRQDSSEAARTEAAGALGFLGVDDESALEALLGGLRDESVRVRQASGSSLFTRATQGKLDPDLLPLLEELAAGDRGEMNGRPVVRDVLLRTIEAVRRRQRFAGT